MKNAQKHMLERIERAATAGAGSENIECVIAHDFANIGTVYVRSVSDSRALFAIAFDFQSSYCQITLCGEVFEDPPAPLPSDRGPLYRIEKIATHRDLPKPQLIFGVLRYDEDARIHQMLDLVASAADALTDVPANADRSLLLSTTEIEVALAPARRALRGTSNDAEHDALYELAETLGGWLDLAASRRRSPTAVGGSRPVASTRIGERLLAAAERIDGLLARLTERS